MNDFVNGEDIEAEKPRQRWFINLDWFPQNNRSFSAIAQDCLCGTCRKRLGAEGGERAASDLLATIKDCCAKTPDFINSGLPIRQSIFRLILASGNKPIDPEQLSQELNERRVGSHPVSPETLSRLLENDNFYGLSRVEE